MNINYKYFFKNILFNTNESLREFYTDYQKEKNSKNIQNKTTKIWICGLPKSGTTLVEQIMDQLPYLRVDRSIFRDFMNKDHLNTTNYKSYTSFFPPNKFSYIKTHLEFDDGMLNYFHNNKFKIIVTFRDIRDAMISRYYHIKNDKRHWQHELVKNETFEQGFLNSLTKKTNKFPKNKNFIEPLKYYYYWIHNWKKINDKKVLYLWFENYNISPTNYVDKILSFTGFTNMNKEKILNSLKSKNEKDRNIPFSTKIKRKNRSLSTFRSGKTGQWKELFTKKIENEFFKIIPDDLNKILNL